MSLLVRTTRFSRGQLPHWEVENAKYFVTVRCHDSLPSVVVRQLREISDSLAIIKPANDGFARLQRRYFLTMEKYLDAGRGESPLRHAKAAEILISELNGLGATGVAVPHYSIMPNHWHALMVPAAGCSMALHQTMCQLKGRTSRLINAALGRAGPLWQREWFDRWVRSDAEWERCVRYISQNPVKAGLVSVTNEHP